MDATGSPHRARVDALDRLRGVALVGMLVHHVTDWMTGNARAVLPGWPSFALTDVAPVAFFVAAGASMALFVAARRARGVSRVRVAGQVARRYGLLVPVGMGLGWALWRSPFMFGVLEAVGAAVLLAAAVAAAVPARWLGWAAAATLAAGMGADHLARGHDAWLAREVVAGKFPLITYAGFALVGVAVVRTGRHPDRRWAAGVSLAGVGAALALVAAGVVPARYPGGVPYVVPGLAGTAALFALGQRRWPAALAGADRVLRRAAAHTLGVFVAHYGLYAALRREGLLGEVGAPAALAVAVAVTVALCLVAPRVPQPPWSPRTGWRRRPPAERPGPVSSAARTAPPAPALPARARS